MMRSGVNSPSSAVFQLLSFVTQAGEVTIRTHTTPESVQWGKDYQRLHAIVSLIQQGNTALSK